MGGWERFVLGKGVGGGFVVVKGFRGGTWVFVGLRGFLVVSGFFLLVQLHRGVFIEV